MRKGVELKTSGVSKKVEEIDNPEIAAIKIIAKSIDEIKRFNSLNIIEHFLS